MKNAVSTFAAFFALSFPAWAENIQSIASAGGDITEILFELGVGDKVVAVDSTSVYPVAVTELPSVGYVRELSAEGVLSTGADLLIGANDMGPPAVMENLSAAGMRIEFAPQSEGPQRFSDKVAFVARVVGEEERGAELIASYEGKLSEIEARREKLSRAPRALLILSLRDGAPVAAGLGTTGNDIMEISGGQNVATFDGWKPMSAEAVIAAAPEVILLSSTHIERMGGVSAVMDLPSIKSTPAGKSASFAVVDSYTMLQFGPRSTEAMASVLAAFETFLDD